jgi:hypothetical protein
MRGTFKQRVNGAQGQVYKHTGPSSAANTHRDCLSVRARREKRPRTTASTSMGKQARNDAVGARVCGATNRIAAGLQCLYLLGGERGATDRLDAVVELAAAGTMHTRV